MRATHGSRRIQHFFAVFLGILLVSMPAYAGFSTSSYAGHQVVAGDFNGDGWSDLLFQALPGNNGEALLQSLINGQLGQPITWSDNHLGTNWNASAHKLVVGDFNGDGKDDVFMQAIPGLASGVMLSDGSGFVKSSQGAITSIGGLDVSQAGHTLIVGDFNGDGRDDLFLQANDGMHRSGIALSGARGDFKTLSSSWQNNALGVDWSHDLSSIVAGDFSGTGRSELLVRSRGDSGVCCRIVGLNKQLKPARIIQSWKSGWLGLDWAPADYKLIAADLNGDGRADLLLQPTSPAGNVSVLLANANGRFTKLGSQWSAERNGIDWSSQSYQLVPEPAAAGNGGSLLMVPKQPGLPYQRAQFDTHGRLRSVKTLKSPPSELLANSGSQSSSMSSRLAATTNSTTSTTSSAVGAVTGKFSVGPAGAAHYSIPIAVAPGVNGVQPKLAIAYGSHNGQTQLGLGWGLSGLSAITRCPATVATDGYAAQVSDQYDQFLGATNRFCLDGSHLIAYSGEKYGADGTEYHTPIATFQHIVSHGAQGSTPGGPKYFTVQDKAGLTREYGLTTNSQIYEGSDSVREWLLDKITDRWGNFITFHYSKQAAQYIGETGSRLSEVDYGNNAGAIVGKVVFSYQSLGEKNTSEDFSGYLEPLVIDHELTNIEVDSANSAGSLTKLWTYQLSYSTPSVGSPRLTSVTRCDSSGDCFAPTQFSYAPLTSGFSSQQQLEISTDSVSEPHPGDFFGDRHTDLIYAKTMSSGARDWYLDGQDTGLLAGPEADSAVVLDANGDGHSDLLYPINYNQMAIDVWNKTDKKLEYLQTLPYLYQYNGGMAAADVVGDGHPWLFFAEPTTINGKEVFEIAYARYEKTTGNQYGFHYVDWGTTNYQVVPGQQLEGIQYEHGVMGLYVGSQNCNSSDPCANSEGVITWDAKTDEFNHMPGAPEGGIVRFLDLNGDGLDDAIQWKNGTWYVHLDQDGYDSTDPAWYCTPPSSGCPPGPQNKKWKVLDYTGDGHADLMYLGKDGSWHVIALAAGDGSQIQSINTGITGKLGPAIDATGHGAWDILQDTGGKWYARLHNEPSGASAGDWPHGGQLTQITTGLGASVKIMYDALTGANSSYYTVDSSLPCDTCAAGADKNSVSLFAAPLYAVTQIQTQESDTGGTPLVTKYHYYNARIDRTGRGFLGFSRIVKTSNFGYSKQTDYETAFPYTGTPTRIVKRGSGGELLSITTNAPLAQTVTAAQAGGAIFPYIKTSTVEYYTGSKGNETGYKQVVTNKLSYNGEIYDGWGDAVDVDVTTKNLTNGHIYDSDTKSSYQNTANNWCIGRLSSSTVLHTGPYGKSIARTSTFGYTPDDKCTLDTQTFEPGVPALTWTKTFSNPDAFGNWRTVTKSGNNFTTRTTKATYDSNGRYQLSKTVMQGSTALTTQYQWDYVKGVKTLITGPNGDAVSSSYDGFDRKVGSSGPYPGQSSNTTYYWCGVSSCQDSRSVYKIVSTTAAAPTVTTEYDQHGRKVAALHDSHDGTVVESYYYDSRGRVYAKTVPYFPSTTPCWVWQRLDDRDRVTETVSAGSASECSAYTPSSATPPSGYSETVTKAYSGLNVTIDDNGRTSTEIFSAAGKLASRSLPSGGGTSGDITGGVTHYEHDAVGDLIWKKDPDGAVTTYGYDDAGHRTVMISNTSGTWNYGYDALGELTSQTDPTGNAITQVYDSTGNLVSRTVTDSAGNTRVSQWHYGTSASSYNLGRLASVTNGDGYSKAYTYNQEGDATQVTTGVDGGSYTVNKTYDNYGQVKSVTYPKSPKPQDDLPPSYVPAALSVSPNPSYDGSYTVSWPAVTGATAYELRESTTSGVGTVAIVYNGAGLSWKASGKQAGSYVYEVRGCDEAGCGNWSHTVTEQVDPPPTGPTPSVSPNPSYDGSYAVSWTSISHASTYQIRQSTDKGTTWSQVYSGSSTTWSTSVSTAGNYSYEVRGCSAVGCGQWGKSVNESVSVPPPGQAPSAGPNPSYDGSYTVSWSSITGATSYRLEESANGGSWSVVYSGGALQWTASGKVTGSYAYRIQGCDAVGCGAWSGSTAEQVDSPPAGSTPSLQYNPSYTGSYTVSWSSIPHATTYQLLEGYYINQNTIMSSRVYSGSGTSWSTSGKTPNNYTYEVRGCDPAGCGAWSPGVTETVKVEGAPGASPNPSFTGSYTVSWSTETGATSYQLQQAVGSGSWSQVYSGSGSSWGASGKSVGTYHYRERACSSSGCGTWSASTTESVSLPTTLAAPALSPNPSDTGGYTVSWNAATGASSYQLQQSANGGAWSQVYSGTGRSWSTSGKANGSYAYRVRPCDALGCTSWSSTSTETVNQTPGVPTNVHVHNLTTKAAGNTYWVEWNAPSYGAVTSYTIQRSNYSNFSSVTSYSTTSTHYAFTYGTLGKTHFYRVKACRNSYCSGWSSTLSVADPSLNIGGGCRTCSPLVKSQPSPTTTGGVNSATPNGGSHSKALSGSGPGSAQAMNTLAPSSGVSSPMQFTRKLESTATVTTTKTLATTTTTTISAPSTTSTWRFTVYYSYDSIGDVTSVYGQDEAGVPNSNYTYWKLVSMDAAGNVTDATRAHGKTSVLHFYDAATGRLMRVNAQTGATVVEDESYTYDKWGSRKTRYDALHNETETYTYDADERVTGSSATLSDGSSATTLSASYDAAGDLIKKVDAGGTINYSYQSGHPNRLGSLTTSGTTPGVTAGNIGYDAAGRITTGAGYTVSYDRRGFAKTVQNSTSTLTLAYAPGGARYRSQLQDSSGTTTVWYLVGGAFRIQQGSDGTVSYRQAIVAGGVMIGQLTTRSDGTDDFSYFYHDGLGSTVGITDLNGGGVQTFAYGPYGRRRASATWSNMLPPGTGPYTNPPTRRGYTGGEQFDSLAVVVLGARVYIPALGRWLSPDPAGIDSPYVYAADNPLTKTDPTGQSAGAVLGIMAMMAAIVVTGGLAAAGVAAWEAGMAGGAIAGFIASEGNFHAAFLGALGGAAMGYLGGLSYGSVAEKALVEGTASGVITQAEGGRFIDGFIGTFASAELASYQPQDTSTTTVVANTVEAAALGGTLSELNGGSFANGAISAAFQQLFNEAQHSPWSGFVKDVSGHTSSQLSQMSAQQSAFKANVDWQKNGSNPATACNDIGCRNMDLYMKSIVFGSAGGALTLFGGDIVAPAVIGVGGTALDLSAQAIGNWRRIARAVVIIGAILGRGGHNYNHNIIVVNPETKVLQDERALENIKNGSMIQRFIKYITTHLPEE